MQGRKNVNVRLVLCSSLVFLCSYGCLAQQGAFGHVLRRATSLPPQATDHSAIPKQDEPTDVDLLWDVKIPMRDGVALSAIVYKPSCTGTPLPVILIDTPYGTDALHPRALYFARNGYVFVAVDCRGRGNSGGRFDGRGSTEGNDGYDLVEWCARQPWSNGKVAMYGHSYRGMTQWLTAKTFAPHLESIAPTASWVPGKTGPLFNNINNLYTLQFHLLTGGVTTNRRIESDSAFWIAKFRTLFFTHAPFKDLDRTVGDSIPLFQEQTQHPRFDAYWENHLPTPADYVKMNLPILTITGQYDGDQLGAMHYYKMHMEYGSREGRDRHFLIIGPWDHDGAWAPSRMVGGLDFGEASLLDLNQLHKQWYDWTLKGGKKPDFLRKRVAYYVLGANEWRYADSLEAIPSTAWPLFLDSADGRANDVFHSGVLSDQRPKLSASDTYTYDPLDVRPAEFESAEVENYFTDQRAALTGFGDRLVYHSAPCTQEVEITGNIRLKAWMAMDVPDTDFQVSVYEVKVDGTSILLAEDRMRARYRVSLKQETPPPLGKVCEYDFATFPFISTQIAKGSRLRLVLKAPNSIFWEKNYNSGGVVAEESGADARVAHITLVHDRVHPSVLEIPVVKKKSV